MLYAGLVGPPCVRAVISALEQRPAAGADLRQAMTMTEVRAALRDITARSQQHCFTPLLHTCHFRRQDDGHGHYCGLGAEGPPPPQVTSASRVRAFQRKGVSLLRHFGLRRFPNYVSDDARKGHGGVKLHPAPLAVKDCPAGGVSSRKRKPEAHRADAAA
ncbi:hypothetical protein SKAU_G00199050 [Synaphobranchus kaupii]|uniref:Uncharacterized protein n=1 Tax=Synaphobranchus kaupii TaxID=118154 RepID=A0A9Q1FF68_SYNKA|nr:hypothetical protein SKAU_G00199050 [Synaphobranchus kaupii]